MTENQSSTKATTASLFIGDMEFDALRIIESGEYRMSQSQVLRAVGLPTSQLAKFRYDRPNKAQKLTEKGFTWVPVLVKYQANGQVRQAKTLSLSDVLIFWRFEDRNGNQKAEKLIDALGADSLRDRMDQVFGLDRMPVEVRREADSRILDIPNPWVRLYEPEFCQTVFSWFGAQFYWTWVYSFLTSEEQAKLNRLNPYNVITGDRAKRIHQYITPEARERLTKHVDQLTTVVLTSTCAQDFLARMARLQKSNQLELKI